MSIRRTRSSLTTEALSKLSNTQDAVTARVPADDHRSSSPASTILTGVSLGTTASSRASRASTRSKWSNASSRSTVSYTSSTVSYASTTSSTGSTVSYAGSSVSSTGSHIGNGFSFSSDSTMGPPSSRFLDSTPQASHNHTQRATSSSPMEGVSCETSGLEWLHNAGPKPDWLRDDADPCTTHRQPPKFAWKREWQGNDEGPQNP